MTTFLSHIGKTSSSRRSGSVALQLPTLVADPFLDRLAGTNAEYVRLYRAAHAIASEGGFDHLKRMDVVRRAKVQDKFQRDIFLFFPAHMPEGADLERIVMYAIWLMHDPVVVGNRPYSAVWVCNNLEASQLGYFWFRRTYKMVPHEYHKNMRSLAIVHPGLGVRLTLLLLSYMLKASFWEKLVYADRIEFLDEVVEPKALELPNELYEYDRFLDREAAQMAEQHLSGAGMGGGMIGGGMMGVGMMGGAYAGSAGGADPLGDGAPGGSAAGSEGRLGARPAWERPYDKALNRDDEEVESEDEDERPAASDPPRIVEEDEGEEEED